MEENDFCTAMTYHRVTWTLVRESTTRGTAVRPAGGIDYRDGSWKLSQWKPSTGRGGNCCINSKITNTLAQTRSGAYNFPYTMLVSFVRTSFTGLVVGLFLVAGLIYAGRR